MKKEVSSLNINGGSRRKFYIPFPRVCPCCNHAIDANNIDMYHLKTDAENINAAGIFFCNNCDNFFFGEYYAYSSHEHTHLLLSQLYPVPSDLENFSDEITTLSPEFVNIYHQAQTAENHGLNKICGMAYRKSLEFLIKDFAIHRNPDDKEIVESMALATCIAKYIPEEPINTLAKKSAWLGNDEAHYVRKHQSRDVSDLKRFITAAVYFINMVLVAEDAESL